MAFWKEEESRSVVAAQSLVLSTSGAGKMWCLTTQIRTFSEQSYLVFLLYYSLCCRELYAVTLVQHSLATSPRTIRLCGRWSPPCFRHSTECFALCMSLANMSSSLTVFSFSCGIRNSGVRLFSLCGNWKTNTPNLTSSRKKKLQELKRSASASRMWVQLGMRWIFLQYRLFKNFKGTNREHFKMRPESHEYLQSVIKGCQSLGSFA